MSEYQMLTLVREEESAISLLDEFSAGFDSLRVYHGRALRFNEIDERLNNNDIDEQYHEIQNLNENNIIPYWYENDQNFEQLLRLNNPYARG
jgi:hypothetical protein